jgi:uncharacterized repeat protein (TIGR03803 family)
VKTDGSQFEVLRDFSADWANGLTPGALTLGPGGYLYGAAMYGGNLNCALPNFPYGCGTLFRLKPDGSDFTVLHVQPFVVG